MTSALLAGLGIGLSLIISIGAQNAYLLQVGMRGGAVVAVVAVCIVSDVALICAGVAGIGAAVASHPVLLDIVTWTGAMVLGGYGLRSLWSAREPSALVASDSAGSRATVGVVSTALAFTWLNPQVYLDALVLLGSASTRYGESRWWFAIGAVIASAVWFSLLGFGARKLSGTLAKPAVWRGLNLTIGLLLLVLAVRLVTSPVAG